MLTSQPISYVGTALNSQSAFPIAQSVGSALNSQTAIYTKADIASNLLGLNFNRIRSRNSTYMADTNCLGGDFRKLQTANPNMCQLICTNDNKCFMWSYDAAINQCSMKNQIRPCSSRPGFVSGQVIEDQLPSSSFDDQRISSRLSNIVFQGTPYRSTIQSDQSICRDVCTSDPNCNRWSYSNNGLCTMWSGMPRSIVQAPGLVSGEIFMRRTISPTPI